MTPRQANTMETRVTHSKKTTAPDGASLLNDYYNEDELAAEIRRSPRTIARTPSPSTTNPTPLPLP